MEKYNDVPIFIGGFSGSGTTMLVDTLDRHKNISGYNETQLIRIFSSLNQQFFSAKSDTYSRYLSRFVSEQDVWKGIRAMADTFLNSKVRKEGKKRWAEKTPLNNTEWKLLKNIFPEAKLIHMIRDGRDVVCSGMGYNYYDLEQGSKAWVNIYNKSCEHLKQIPAEDFIEIKYEDLIFNTETTMRLLLNFLNEEWDPVVLDLQKSAKFTRKWGKDAGCDSPVARWKQDTNFDKKVFHEIAGELLIQLGYEQDDNWCR